MMRALILSLALSSTVALADDYYPLTTGNQTILGTKTFVDGISSTGTTILGDAGVAGNVTINGTLTVNGDAGVAGGMAIGSDLTALGLVSTTDGVLTSGQIQATSPTIVHRIFGNLLIGNDAGIGGSASIAQESVLGNLGVDGGEIVAGTLAVGGVSTMAAIQGQDAGFNALNTTAGVTITGQLAETNHAATQQAVQCGKDAGTSGVLTVAFSPAFSVAPICTCGHVDTTNTNTCTIDHTVVPTTAVARFNVASGGTDVITYCCIGGQ